MQDPVNIILMGENSEISSMVRNNIGIFILTTVIEQNTFLKKKIGHMVWWG